LHHGQNFVVNYDKRFANGNFFDAAFGACESAIINMGLKNFQPLNHEAAANIDSNNNEARMVQPLIRRT